MQRAPVAMQLRTGLIISSPSIHKYCSASSNSEPITVALQSSRVSMILNRSTEPCVDILLGSSGNLLGRYRKMKATSNEMIVRATGTFTLCASQIWTPEMEEKLCRSDAQRPGDGLRSRVHADHQPHGAGHRQDGARRGGRARRRHRPGAHPGRQVLHGPGWPLLHAGEHAAFRGREPPEARVHPRRGRVPEGLSYEDIQFEVQ